MAKYCLNCQKKIPFLSGTTWADGAYVCEHCLNGFKNKTKKASFELHYCIDCGELVIPKEGNKTEDGWVCKTCSSVREAKAIVSTTLDKSKNEHWQEIRMGKQCARCYKSTGTLLSLGDSFVLCSDCNKEYETMSFDGTPAAQFLLSKLREVSAGTCSFAVAHNTVKEKESAIKKAQKDAELIQQWNDVEAGTLCARCCKATGDLQSLGDGFMICGDCNQKYSLLSYDGIPATQYILKKLCEVKAGTTTYEDARKVMLKKYMEAQKNSGAASSTAKPAPSAPKETNNFSVSFGKEDTVNFDEKAKKWQVKRVFSKDSPVYNFSDIVKYEYQEQVQKKGGAISSFGNISFGQSIGGEAGKLAGALHSLTPPKVEAMCVLITVKTASGLQIEKAKLVSPTFSMEKGTAAYNKNFAEVSRLCTYLDELLAEKNRTASAVPVAPAASVVPAFSAADELKKFKELLDMGVISQEDFDAKKKKLLGL